MTANRTHLLPVEPSEDCLRSANPSRIPTPIGTGVRSHTGRPTRIRWFRAHQSVWSTCCSRWQPTRTDQPATTTPWWLARRRAHRFGHGDQKHGDDGSGTDGVLAAVRERAREVHARLGHQHDVCAVEFVGSTGGGKTALAERLIDRWDCRVGVICGDVAGEDDARRYREHGVPVVNVTTGRECHLDPQRIDDALDTLDLEDLDTLVIENVGNMVCPADFPLGATVRLLVVSPTEGDDVVRKHPLLFQSVDAAVVNKVDIADAVGADTDRMVADAAEVAPDLPVFRTSVETGRGIENLAAMLQTHREHGHHHA